MLLGIDTGGTFTDLIAFSGRELRTHKVLSTRDNPARAVLQGLREMLPEAAALQLTYSTTVATNALLERKGARVLLLTTAGFEDLIEIGRQNRSSLYALEPRRPQPLVPRAARIGVAERMLYDGTVQRPLRPRHLKAILRLVQRRRPDAVAVCLLHSYANPQHENRIGKALAGVEGLFCSLSHQLIREYREYERLSTTVINAYVGPIMSRHLDTLARGLGRRGFRVLQSNGGAISSRLAAIEAVRTCLSGPAGGVAGAWHVARALGLRQVITFDMGGTSTDVSVVNGSPSLSTSWEIGGLPVKVPSIDIHTVGAGGGSLAYIDPGGVLKVGPESAGADPGPACYGRGARATVTDANVVLGRVVSSAFLGGRMALDEARATAALDAIGRSMRLSAVDAAAGVVRVVNASMERAIRRVSVERGHDPRDYALIAFGGAGGQHACELAEALRMRRVVIPLHPGLLSAWGAAMADVQRDYVATVRLIEPTARRLGRDLRPLELRARRELAAEGIGKASSEIVASFDVRYVGQSHEINVAADRDFRRAFHATHRRLYGYADPTRPLEVVNLRVQALGRTPHAAIRFRPPDTDRPPQRHRLRDGGRWRKIDAWSRSELRPGRQVHGPAVIVEFSATTYVPRGWTATVHATGHLLVDRM